MTRVIWTRQAVEDVVIHGNYRLVYRLQAESVEIVTIYHTARLLRV